MATKYAHLIDTLLLQHAGVLLTEENADPSVISSLQVTEVKKLKVSTY